MDINLIFQGMIPLKSKDNQLCCFSVWEAQVWSIEHDLDYEYNFYKQNRLSMQI